MTGYGQDEHLDVEASGETFKAVIDAAKESEK